MTRLRFSSGEILEEAAGDCDDRKRRAVVPEGEAAAAAGWKRASERGARDVAEEWAQRRDRVEIRDEEAARRRSLAASDADDMARALVFLWGSDDGYSLPKSRVLRGLKAEWRRLGKRSEIMERNTEARGPNPVHLRMPLRPIELILLHCLFLFLFCDVGT